MQETKNRKIEVSKSLIHGYWYDAVNYRAVKDVVSLSSLEPMDYELRGKFCMIKYAALEKFLRDKYYLKLGSELKGKWFVEIEEKETLVKGIKNEQKQCLHNGR